MCIRDSYWDEGWSYAPAVEKMAAAGPSLLSGRIDIELTRGHPLFFYAAAATWIKLLGDSLLTRHLFALSISLVFLLAIFTGMRRLFNFRIALLASFLAATQVIFFVQSSMMLPEVMVALFVYLAIYFFAIKNYPGLGVSLTLLLQTKESGLVLWLILAAAFLLLLIRRDKTYHKWRLGLALIMPVLFVGLFFVYQRIKYGWFFFPEHMNLIEHDFAVLRHKFLSILKLVFAAEKRKWFWAGTVLLTLAGIYINRQKWRQLRPTPSQAIFMIVSGVFIGLYIIFCTFNFYSERYLLAAIVPSLLLMAWLMDTSIRVFDLRTYLPVAVVILAFTVQNFARNQGSGDTGMYSYRVLDMQQRAIDYLLRAAQPGTPITVGGFLQRVNLQEPACGFLRGKPPFTNVTWDITAATEFILFDNMDGDTRVQEITGNPDFRLVYHSQDKGGETKIFRRKPR